MKIGTSKDKGIGGYHSAFAVLLKLAIPEHPEPRIVWNQTSTEASLDVHKIHHTDIEDKLVPVSDRTWRHTLPAPEGKLVRRAESQQNCQIHCTGMGKKVSGECEV